MAQADIIARMYKVRINQPGFGPRIVACFMSDLQAGDLSTQNIICNGTGAPSSTALLAGFTNYLKGDFYFDDQGEQAYVCTGAGTNQVGQAGGSTWGPIGSGGGYGGYYNPASAYQSGTIVKVANTTVVGGITIFAGCYGAVQNVPAVVAIENPGNMVPQFPVPSQGAYWHDISFTAQAVNQNCGTGFAAFVNATNPITISST